MFIKIIHIALTSSLFIIYKKNKLLHDFIIPFNVYRNSTPYGTLPRGDVGRGVRLPLLYPPSSHGNQNGNQNGNGSYNGNTGNRGGGPGTPGTPGGGGDGDGDDDVQNGNEEEKRNDK